MQPVIIPVMMYMLLGNTIDLRTYDLRSISVSDSNNYEEVLVNQTSTAYMVLEDTFPFECFDIPVDVALRIKFEEIYELGIPTMRDLIRYPEWKKKSVIVAFTTIHRTVDRKLKGDISLPTVDDQKLPSHYVEEVLYGGRATALIEFRCTDPGDVELVKKRVKSVLGESGELTEITKDLWQNVIEAVYNREGLRGYVHANSELFGKGAPLFPKGVFGSWNYIEPLFDFPQQIKDEGAAMIMKLKPLHDLDPSYPVAEKNNEVEEELKELYEMFDDLEIARRGINDWTYETEKEFTDEEYEIIYNLKEGMKIVKKAMYSALDEPSVYSDMNMTAMEIAGRLYKYYLNSNYNASSYYMSYLKLREDLDEERCENEFWPEKDGILQVESGEKEILSYEPESLDMCKEECFNKRRCRAIAYVDQQLNSNQPKKCWIYYRSSTTAAVISNDNETNENMKTYDRKCI